MVNAGLSRRIGPGGAIGAGRCYAVPMTSPLPIAPAAADHPGALPSALRTLRLERAGILALEQALDQPESDLGQAFDAAVRLLVRIPGRIIVTGMGKSGHIGRKLAATLASTGSPAYFVHAAEASHGDLGMIQATDAVLAMSWSGESAELAHIITYARRFAIPLIAITSNAGSSLGREASLCLTLPRAEEACPNGLAPTTSTTMQLAMGDALAIALLEARGFSALDFKTFHPGGKLGARLTFVRDVMHKDAEVPRIPVEASMAEAVVEMTGKRFGCVCVLDGAGRLAGLITDGDLRRHMGPDLMRLSARAVMTASPLTFSPDDLAAQALALLTDTRRSVLPIVDGDRRLIGIVHIHDLNAIGVA